MAAHRGPKNHRHWTQAIVLPDGLTRARSDLEKREIGEKILSARNRGLKLHEAVVEFDISEYTGRKYMELALAARIAPTVDDFRKQQNDALDETQQKITGQYQIADAIGQKAVELDSLALLERAAAIRDKAISAQLRLDERRAKLNGLDAPIVADVNVRVADVVDDELQGMIREAQARAEALRHHGA